MGGALASGKPVDFKHRLINSHPDDSDFNVIAVLEMFARLDIRILVKAIQVVECNSIFAKKMERNSHDKINTPKLVNTTQSLLLSGSP